MVSKDEALRTWVGVVRGYQHAARLMAEVLKPLDMSVPQFDVLTGLYRGDGITQRALGDRLLTSKANLNGLLNRLGGQGLVERRPHPEDARAKRVYLTDSGKELVLRALAAQQRLIDATLASLGRDDVRQLGAIMERLRARFDDSWDDGTVDRVRDAVARGSRRSGQ